MYSVVSVYSVPYILPDCRPGPRVVAHGRRTPGSIIGRAGASPHSRTAAIIFLYIYIFIYLFIYIRVVRRALNLLRASFSPIFQYFIFPNLYS